MNLGQAVYKMLAGRTPRFEEDPDAMVRRAIREAGGVSQLARAIGVARTTVQRWQKGSTPTLESQELLRSVLRRADLKAGREVRLRTRDRLVVSGKHDGRDRRVNLSPYLRADTMAKAVDAYLRGASVTDIHVIVWSGITDRAYRWMFQPPGGLAQQPAREQREAAREAFGGGYGGGGGGGGSGAPGGAGAADDDGEDFEDLYDDYGDLRGEEWDFDIGDNSGYEFAAASASGG